MSDMASIHFLIEENGHVRGGWEILPRERDHRIPEAGLDRTRDGLKAADVCGLRVSYSWLLECSCSCSWLRRMLPLGCEMRRFGDANFGYIWGFETRFVSRDIYYYYFARLPLLSN